MYEQLCKPSRKTSRCTAQGQRNCSRRVGDTSKGRSGWSLGGPLQSKKCRESWVAANWNLIQVTILGKPFLYVYIYIYIYYPLWYLSLKSLTATQNQIASQANTAGPGDFQGWRGCISHGDLENDLWLI